MLKLKDANVASVFGLPQKDCEYADLLKLAPKDHIDAAIAAGAYTKEETPKYKARGEDTPKEKS